MLDLMSNMSAFLDYLVASGSDLSRFVFFTLRHELSLGTKTLDPVLRVTAWSLNVIWKQLVNQI